MKTNDGKAMSLSKKKKNSKSIVFLKKSAFT